MRRLWAISLFSVLVLPALLPLFAFPHSKPDSLLPACCRRNGKHHCAMSAMAEAPAQGTSIRQQPVACPYRSGSLVLAHGFAWYPPATFSYYADLIQYPSVQRQAAISLLVSNARSHQKRGPPSLT